MIGGPRCPHLRQWLPGPLPGTSVKMPCAVPGCDEGVADQHCDMELVYPPRSTREPARTWRTRYYRVQKRDESGSWAPRWAWREA